ncbi:MAG: restriction endonuclease subunit R, partial [Chthonomonadaceae bacterium]|nr:restriction endonuclease subunit R [Chthonomonadaceae bacterium]
MPVPDSVVQLVSRFEANLSDYKKSTYNETEVRRELIDPLFAALGWTMDNKNGLGEETKEVVHEFSMKIEGKAKAPDYGFKVGKELKFFVEAKKPSVNLKNNSASAFQIRRYAWSAKLSVSILTDFEEFAVYDGQIVPSESDGAG